MTTALMAMFAACTNDEFLDKTQGVQNGEAALRPTVDVTLNVLEGDGADTRLGYDNGYKWKEGDKIGALLMDEIRGYWEDGNQPVRPFDDLEGWAEKPWTERYKLVDYVSTDYPFERQADGTWTTNSKMLEGNYFFTFPFANYMGNREAVHSIGEQVQNGRDVATAYAQNQFFIGYSRIFAGTDGNDVMSSNLELTPVLGGIGITIVNNDDTPFTVKKVVLESTDFSTLIKIDPTRAKYVGEDANNITVKEPYYNIDKNEVAWWSTSQTDTEEKQFFNYANYEEVENSGVRNEYGEVIWKAISPFGEMYKDGKWVNNTGRSGNYMRQSALREIINKVESSEHRAEVTIENSPEIGARGELQVMVMTTPYVYNGETDEKKTNAIEAWIYTDRGIAGPINITNVQNATSNGVTVNAAEPITFVRPGRANAVTLMLHTNSIKMGAAQLDIYNESDLKQLIEWNEGIKRIYEANLKADVVLDKEMSDMLMSENWQNSNLRIVTNNYKVTLAEGVSKNILDKVLVKGNVEVEGELELGSKSFVNGKYTIAYAEGFGSNSQEATVEDQVISIAENATVNIVSNILDVNEGNWRQDNVVFGDNEGTLNINADVKKFEIKNNEGKMNVNAEVTLNATSFNNAGGYITIAEGADLSGLTGAKETYLCNKGTTHGELLGDLRYNEENVEPAVIDNYGRLSGLMNQEYGKLIARTEAGPMVVAENQAEAIIDITDDIEADVQFQTANAGDVVYAVKAENTAKEIFEAKAGITALQMEGGKVTAPAADGNIVLGITKLRSTEKGGVIGSNDATIAFPMATLVEFNGALELNNVDLSGNAQHVTVKSGTTTIKGNVNLITYNQNTNPVTLEENKSRGFVLASYDAQLLKEVPAELHISSGAILKAWQITRAEKGFVDANGSNLVDKTKAVVDNNGTVYLYLTNMSTADVDWRQKKPEDLEAPKPIAGEVIALEADQTFAELMDTYADLSNVKKIEISNSVVFAEDGNSSAAVLEFLKDKEIVIKTYGANLEIKGTLGVAFKKLTVEESCTVYSGDNNPAGGVMLTLNELEVAEVVVMYVKYSSIAMANAEQGAGFGSNYIKQDGEIIYTNGGMITAKTAQGQLLGWDKDNEKWVNK